MTIHFAPAKDESRRFIALDYERNTIYSASGTIRLAGQQADILYVLLSNRSNPVSTSKLVRLVYGVNRAEGADKSMRVVIHGLRRKLAGTGLTIKTRFGAGYQVEFEEISRPESDLRKRLHAALEAALRSGDRIIAEQLHAMIKDFHASEYRVSQDSAALRRFDQPMAFRPQSSGSGMDRWSTMA